MAVFRSPSDREQIGIIAERMFDKNRQRFMTAYYQETERAFRYIFVDNRPDTPGKKQVLTDIFDSCRRYPSINKSSKSEQGEAAPLKTSKCVDKSPPQPLNHSKLFGLKQVCPFGEVFCKERPFSKPFQKVLVFRKCTPVPEILSILVRVLQSIGTVQWPVK